MIERVLKQSLLMLSTLILSCVFLQQSSVAQMYPMDSDIGVDGEELFDVCSFCHGAQGQGGPALDAPALAGMEAWYVERQLHNFRDRIRGTHYDDVPGVQMSIVSGMVRNDATIKNIADYIEGMEPGAPPELTAQGEIAGTARPFIWRSKYADLQHSDQPNVEQGAKIYAQVCVVCHSADASGNEVLGAPNLRNFSDWYMHRQIQYFRDGIRGADTRDVYGQQMAAFSKTLTDEQAIADVVAYVKTLAGE